jgi:hypothetical protein
MFSKMMETCLVEYFPPSDHDVTNKNTVNSAMPMNLAALWLVKSRYQSTKHSFGLVLQGGFCRWEKQ